MSERTGNIYLCGMIGSGKTTIGRRLAEELEWPFIDLDREMDRILGYSFHRLVQEKGWVAFRELEYSICKRLAHREKSLICLGGGTVRYEWNMDVLRGTGFFILLTASLGELVRRVRNEQRPRVNIGTSLEEDLRAIWEQSEEKYRRAANAVVDTDGKSIEAAVAELDSVVRRFIPIQAAKGGHGMGYDIRNAFQNLARYNERANRELYLTLSQLTDQARKRDAGSWFGSIHGILNHVIITDMNWLKRYRALSPESPVLTDPQLDPPNLSWDHDLHEDFEGLRQTRVFVDAKIRAWFAEFPIARGAEEFQYHDSRGTLRRASAGAAFEFLFLHQTHHRGQISQILDTLGLPNNFADNAAYLEGLET